MEVRDLFDYLCVPKPLEEENFGGEEDWKVPTSAIR
jgi:hypothetical protein